MESRNPVFARAEGFNARAQPRPTPADSSTPTRPSGAPARRGGPVTEVGQGRMTIDTVVQKTGMTLGVVVIVAAATWFLTGDIDTLTQAQLSGLYGLSVIGALGGFALAMVNTFKKVVSPAADPPLRSAPGCLRRCVQQGASKPCSRGTTPRPAAWSSARSWAPWPLWQERSRRTSSSTSRSAPASTSGSSLPGWASWR